jgi:murein DD-endopeptidase MepM/ murein hydrolase activator NlpD
MGNPIVAPADGVVTSVGADLDYGRLIFIDHGHGFATKYGHLKNVYVQKGEKVKKGQLIAAVGSTGHSTGPHLHYEVRIQGNPVNPIPYLKERS